MSRVDLIFPSGMIGDSWLGINRANCVLRSLKYLNYSFEKIKPELRTGFITVFET